MFPSCSEPGLEIVRALVDQPGLEVVGGSSLLPSRDPSSLILRQHLSIPWLKSEAFHDSLASIVRGYDIDVVFPATDDLIAELSRSRMDDVAVVAPRPEVAETCLSKEKTYERLNGMVPVPRIFEEDDRVEFPAYAKPREEAGMRGHMQVNDPDGLAAARRRNLLVTEFLPGEEYEVNCLGDLEGTLLYANIRTLGRRVGAHVLDSQGVDDAPMTAYVERIAAELRIEGPWFAQFKRDQGGHPVLIEVNARIGGGSGLNRFCGVNLPLLAVRLFTGQAVPPPISTGRAGVTRCLQFFVNIEPIRQVVWKWNALIRGDGKVNPRVMACLFDLRNRGIPQYLLCPVDADIRGFLEEREIPRCFEDIVPCGDEEGQGGWHDALRRLCTEPFQQNVFVGDGVDPSGSAIQERLPGIRVATPDTLELLGMERR